MVLVAVTGPVGSGKTTVLSSLLTWAKGNGKSVDGFLALPHDRVEPGKGAEEYVLQLIDSGQRLPFVRRDSSLTPPYRIDAGTVTALAALADSLKARHPLSILILDEFGPLEARGDGHMKHWESIQASRPEVVVIAVREKVVREIESRLGTPFDVVFDVTETGVSNSFKTWCCIIPIGYALGNLALPRGDLRQRSVLHCIRQRSRWAGSFFLWFNRW